MEVQLEELRRADCETDLPIEPNTDCRYQRYRLRSRVHDGQPEILICGAINILRANEVTFTEREMIFQYPFSLFGPPPMDSVRKQLSAMRAPEKYLIYKKLVIAAAPDLARYEGFRLTDAQQLEKSEADKLHVDIDAAREISGEFQSMVMTWRDTSRLLRSRHHITIFRCDIRFGRCLCCRVN
jgi:hypothetical protein